MPCLSWIFKVKVSLSRSLNWNGIQIMKSSGKEKERKTEKEKGKTDNWATSAHSGPASLYSTRSPHARLPYRFCAPLADRRARSAASVTDAVLWATEVSSVFSLALDSAGDAGSTTLPQLPLGTSVLTRACLVSAAWAPSRRSLLPPWTQGDERGEGRGDRRRSA